MISVVLGVGIYFLMESLIIEKRMRVSVYKHKADVCLWAPPLIRRANGVLQGAAISAVWAPLLIRCWCNIAGVSVNMIA